MKSSPVLQKKRKQEKRGRPITRAGAYDKVTAIRLSPELRARIDAWAVQQEDKPPRSIAIRRMIEIVLAESIAAAKPRRPAKAGAKSG